MNQHRQSTITHESLEALLEALGFEDMHNPHEVLNPSSKNATSDDSRSSLVKERYGTVYDYLCPEEEAIEFSQTYMYDYDFGSDLDEESSDDYDDTLPSRPSSIFEMVQVDAPAPAPATPRSTHFTPSPRSSISTPGKQSATLRSSNHLSLHLQKPAQRRYCLYDTTPSPSTLSFSTRSSDSSLPSPTESLCVKAALNASIIMLRVPRTITFEELKHRLHEKFVKQEGILLKSTFSVVNVLAPSDNQSVLSPFATSPRPGVSRARSESMASVFQMELSSFGPRSPPAPRRVSFAERTEMRFVDSEAEWQKVVSVHDEGSKIALRVLDTSL